MGNCMDRAAPVDNNTVCECAFTTLFLPNFLATASSLTALCSPCGGSGPAVMAGCSGVIEQGASALRVPLGSEWCMDLPFAKLSSFQMRAFSLPLIGTGLSFLSLLFLIWYRVLAIDYRIG